MIKNTRKLGSRRCQCGGCGLYFTGMTAFERHRTGAFGSGNRRCMTTAEMTESGLILNSDAWWTVPMSENAISSFTQARNSAPEAPGDAEVAK